MTMFSVYFPGRTSVDDADIYGADTHKEAAEKAARQKCQKDVEWRDLRVAVAAPGEGYQHFDVEVISAPEFVATPARSHESD